MNDQDNSSVQNDSSVNTGVAENGLDLASLLRAISSVTPPVDKATSEASEKSKTTEAKTNDGGDLLSSLLSSPQLLTALPTVITTIKPLLEGIANPSSTVRDPPEATASEPVSAQGEGKGNGGSRDRHSALLCAMKPYLGQSRQSAVDYILKLSLLGDVLKNL